MDQNEKRELIKKIKADTNLTEKEKNIKIQQIFSSNYINTTQNKSNNSITCSHYDKSCSKFKFECCNIIDPCKRCHIERNCTDIEKKCSNIKSIKISHITCIKCNLEQEPSQYCSNPECKIKFSNSYCKICQIWTHKQNIFHCNDCGICRIGTEETLFHCYDCGICFDKSTKQSHQCSNSNQNKISKWTNGLCVICNESTFNSLFKPIILPCSHFIHEKCYSQYLQQNNYKCPHCKKSIIDLTTQWNFIRSQIKLYPIPNEMLPIELNDIVDTPFGKFQIESINILNDVKLFRGKFINWTSDKHCKTNVYACLNYSMIKKNLYKNIYCNDCEKKSLTCFHYYGLECIYCGSFNTQE